MDLLLLIFIALAILLLIVLVMGLFERVNALERDTKEAVRTLGSSNRPAERDAPPVLAGRALWEALSSHDSSESVDLVDARARAESVYCKHIESLFNEGVMDGKLGAVGNPRNSKLVVGQHGPLESWIPEEMAKAVYLSGVELSQAAEGKRFKARQMLDDACTAIFSSLRISPSASVADMLIVDGTGPGKDRESES